MMICERGMENYCSLEEELIKVNLEKNCIHKNNHNMNG